MSDEVNLEQFDEWLKDDSDSAALVMSQKLKPIEEVAFERDSKEKSVIFPPTYATGEGESPYSINRFDDGSSICQIDSVGSQANRMEPLFKRGEYRHLVPKVSITTADGSIDLLDAGHRAADAVRATADATPGRYAALRGHLSLSRPGTPGRELVAPRVGDERSFRAAGRAAAARRPGRPVRRGPRPDR